jgi:hypothetical protein
VHKEKKMRILKVMFQKGIDRYLTKSLIRGQGTAPKQYSPLHREETEECVELLDILEIRTQKRFY